MTAVVRVRRMSGAGGRQLPHQCNVKWGRAEKEEKTEKLKQEKKQCVKKVGQAEKEEKRKN